MPVSEACGVLMPLAIYWGSSTPVMSMELLLIVPSIFDLLRLFIRAVLYMRAERTLGAFSIMNVLTYHQREIELVRKRSPDQITDEIGRAAAARAHADRIIRARGPAIERAQAAATASVVASAAVRVSVLETMPPSDHRRRRHIQKALKLCDALSLCAWLLCMALRRPWGLLVAVVSAALSLFGVAWCPLPAEAEERSLSRVVTHYAFAALAFMCFGSALLLSHGYCGWPALPFVLCVLLAATMRLLCQIDQVASHHRVAKAMRLVAILCEWSAVLVFYFAVMLPPAYSVQHQT